MPEAALLIGAYKRTGFANVPTLNCIAEKDKLKADGRFALIARPGLEEFENVGTAPIRAMFQKQGLFSNSALVFAAGTVYGLDASAATMAFTGVNVAGSGLLDVAGGLDADLNSIARVANGTNLYLINSATNSVIEETVSGANGAASVDTIGGYWIVVEEGSDSFFYLEPAGTVWNALEFASAEYAPDRLVAVRVAGEFIALLGEATTEIWRLTGNASSPLEPYGGLKFDFGCRSRPAAVNCRGTLIWPDDTCQVRLFDGGSPKLISDNGLAEQIAAANPADLRASFFVVRGHPLYVLTLGATATWVYDLSTQDWTQFSSLGFDYWRAHLHCNIGDLVLAADALSNQVWRVDPDRQTDGDDTFTMEFCAYIEAEDAAIPLANLELRCLTGASPRSGQGSDPKAVLQISPDRGQTWGQPKERGLGTTGDYTKRVRWTGLSRAKPPNGALCKFAISDPVIRRVSGVGLNVPG